MSDSQPQARLSWRIENAAAPAADIYIYDVIGDPWGDGTTGADFVKQVAAVKSSQINVHISSPGGVVSDGLAMFNALKMHPANVTAYIDSMAASAASFVAMAANTISIAKNAQMIIHDAQGMAMGPASLARALADTLDEESQNIASIYAERAGGTADGWRAAMQANNEIGTSYRGQAAVDAGLADEVTQTPVKDFALKRIAALIEEDSGPVPEAPPTPIDISLIPHLATGYKPPLPADFTRLLAAQMPKGA